MVNPGCSRDNYKHPSKAVKMRLPNHCTAFNNTEENVRGIKGQKGWIEAMYSRGMGSNSIAGAQKGLSPSGKRQYPVQHNFKCSAGHSDLTMFKNFWTDLADKTESRPCGGDFSATSGDEKGMM